MDPFTHDAYTKYGDLKEVFQQLQGQIHIEEGDGKDDHNFQNGLLYKLENICVPKGKRLQLIREVHTSKVVGHFVVGKTISNL